MGAIWIIIFVLQWILLLILAVLMVGVLRYLSFVQRNIHLVTRYESRFEEGDRISHFELSDLSGLPVLSEALLKSSQNTLLFFLSPGCSGCKAVIRQVADMARQKGGLKRFAWSFVFISTGSHALAKEFTASLPLNDVNILVDEEGVLYRRYDIRTFPITIAVDKHGSVLDQHLGDVRKWLPNILNSSPSSQKTHPFTFVDH